MSPQDLPSKPESRWRQFWRLPEAIALAIGLGALFILAVHYFAMHRMDDIKANHLWKIIGFHIVGGAPVGAAKGALYPDMTAWDSVAINSLLTIAIIFIPYALFCLSCRKLFHVKFLEQTFSGLKSSARTQKKTWIKFGIPGIFAFVLFPMTGTGPIIGAVLGRLIGLGFWTDLITVTGASITSIIAFAFAAEKMSRFLGDRALNIAVGIFIGILLLLAAISKVRSWWKQRNTPATAISGTDENAEQQQEAREDDNDFLSGDDG